MHIQAYIATLLQKGADTILNPINQIEENPSVAGMDAGSVNFSNTGFNYLIFPDRKPPPVCIFKTHIYK